MLARTRHALALRVPEGRLRQDLDVDGTARALIALMDGLQVQFLLERGDSRPRGHGRRPAFLPRADPHRGPRRR
ncbi:TetR family transcriptional regulator C-terminal domain-containing protein [Oerskovia sp. M15]